MFQPVCDGLEHCISSYRVELTTVSCSDGTRPSQSTGHHLTSEEEAARLALFFNLTPYYAVIRDMRGQMHSMEMKVRKRESAAKSTKSGIVSDARRAYVRCSESHTPPPLTGKPV